MHVLIIGINYAPEEIGIGENSTQLCEYLVSRGHKISIVTTFPHYPEWKIRHGYRGKLFMREEINGVLVRRVYSCVPRRSTNAFQRIFHDTTFAIAAFFGALPISDVDVIFSFSPPLQGGITGYLLSKIKKAKFALRILDLVPDLAITLGILKNRFAIKMAKKMERFVYNKAEVIVVLCKGFMDNLKLKGVPDSKMVLLSNWVDTNVIKPIDKNNTFRTSNNLDKRFVVLHSGNMGAKHKLENVIDAAQRLSDIEDIQFLLIGDGPMRGFLVEKAAGMNNIRFMPLQPKSTFPYLLAAADVLVLNQSANVVDTVIPYKLITYMAAGRPIAASVNEDSETARYIRWADCGMIVPPEEPDALAEAIRTIYKDRTNNDRFGQNARAFSERHFAKEEVLGQYLKFLVDFDERGK